MSIFDKAVSQTDASNPITSEYEGFLALLYAGISSDGKQKSSEINLALDIMIHKKMFNNADTHDWIGKMKSLKEQVGDEGKFINYAADKITPGLRPMVFANVVDMMLADGEVADTEKRTLEMMQKALKVDDNLALKIIEVVVVKNKGG
jgi:uncharacterized tellurite resistance protein B-like protein